MNLNKKFSLSISFLAVLSVLTACSNLPSGINFEDNTSKLSAMAKDNDIYIKDIGYGVKTNVSLSFRVNLGDGNNTFNIKDNVPGAEENEASDVNSIKGWLFEATTGSPPSAGASVTPVSGTEFSYDNSGTTPVITYTNVGPNTSGKSYYVAVAAYSELTASQATENNITNISSATNRIKIDGTEPAAFSAGGGDTSGTNDGSVNVDSAFAVSSTSNLTVNVKLLDATGVTIDANVSFSDGSATPGALFAE